MTRGVRASESGKKVAAILTLPDALDGVGRMLAFTVA